MSGHDSWRWRLAALTLVLPLLVRPASALAQTEADSAWLNGDMARAERLYVERLASDPSDERALHRVALARAWDARYEESLTMLGHLLEISPDNLEARVDRAKVYAWRGDLSTAIDLVDGVLATNPDYLPALKERARFEAWLGNLESAVAMQNGVLVRAGEDREAWRGLARYLAWGDRAPEAIAVYDSLLRSDPTDRESRLGLATALSWSDQLDSAARVYDGLVAENPADREALIGSARVAAWSGDLVEAEGRWRRALAHEPDDPAALTGLGQTLRWQGRSAAALPLLERAADLLPDDEGTKQELLLARRSLAPRLRPGLLYESDSDANRILTGSLTFAAQATRHVALVAELYGRSARITDTPLETASWGGLMEVLASFKPGWDLSGGLGVSGSDAPGAEPIVALRARLASPARHRFGGSISFTHGALDESARLILNRVRRTIGGLQLRLAPSRGWRVGGGASIAEYVGSEPNQRIGGHASMTRSLSPSWRLGVYVNAFGFDKNLNDGYFDPSFYGIAEVGIEWNERFGLVRTGVIAAPGVQQVGTEGNARATGRGSGYASFEIAPGRELGVRATYNATGLNSLATGDADYRYFSASLTGSWAF